MYWYEYTINGYYVYVTVLVWFVMSRERKSQALCFPGSVYILLLIFFIRIMSDNQQSNFRNIDKELNFYILMVYILIYCQCSLTISYKTELYIFYQEVSYKHNVPWYRLKVTETLLPKNYTKLYYLFPSLALSVEFRRRHGCHFAELINTGWLSLF